MSLQGGTGPNRIEELEGEVARLKEELAKFVECHPVHVSKSRDLECSWSFLEGTRHGGPFTTRRGDGRTRRLAKEGPSGDRRLRGGD